MVVVWCSECFAVRSAVAKMVNHTGVFGSGMRVDSLGQVQVMPEEFSTAPAFCESNQYANDENATENKENNIHTMNVGFQRDSFNQRLIELRFQPAVKRMPIC